MGVMYRQEDFERPLGKEKGHSLAGICRANLAAPAVCPEPKIFLGRIVQSFDKCMLRCAWQHASNDYRDLSPFFSASSWGDKTFKQPRKC